MPKYYQTYEFRDQNCFAKYTMYLQLYLLYNFFMNLHKSSPLCWFYKYHNILFAGINKRSSIFGKLLYLNLQVRVWPIKFWYKTTWSCSIKLTIHHKFKTFASRCLKNSHFFQQYVETIRIPLFKKDNGF
jgi:hypothetical protein